MRILFAIVCAFIGLAVASESFAQQQIQTNNPCLVQQQNVPRIQEGTQIQNLPCLRDGSIKEVPWREALALEGREYCVNYGQGTTYITGHVGGPTSGQPDANLDIPSGTSIIPMFLTVYINAVAGTAPIQYTQFNTSLIGNGTSNAATQGPFNTRLADQPFASRTTARQAYSGTGTAPAASAIFEISPLPTPAAAQTTTWN